MPFKQGDYVWITRLGGDNHEAKYLGRVCGLSMDGVIRIYIVEVSPEDGMAYQNPIPGQGEWSHVTIPETCLDMALSSDYAPFVEAIKTYQHLKSLKKIGY